MIATVACASHVRAAYFIELSRAAAAHNRTAVVDASLAQGHTDESTPSMLPMAATLCMYSCVAPSPFKLNTYIYSHTHTHIIAAYWNHHRRSIFLLSRSISSLILPSAAFDCTRAIIKGETH